MLDIYKKKGIRELLLAGSIGLEKENIRVHENGMLAETPHPFGNKSKHPYIITDYSESQVEIGTVVCNNPDEVYDQLENLHDIVTTTIAVQNEKTEYLWPMSNPPLFRSEEAIPIARYDEEHKDKEVYRDYLAAKYGKKIMLYSGIHYNYSFNDMLLRRLHSELGRRDELRFLKSEMYMRMAKNCYMYSWFPVYMTAASPIFHESFMDCGEEVGGGRFMGYASMRNSKYGYWNREQMILDFTDLNGYIDSIVAKVRQKQLYSTAELYTPVRLKPKGQYLMKNLREGGVNHIELRMFDLNPLDKNGMSKVDMQLMEYFLFYLTTLGDFDYSEELQRSAGRNHISSAAFDPDSAFIEMGGEKKNLRAASLELIDKMTAFYDELEQPEAIKVLETARERASDPDKLYAHQIYNAIKKEGYISFGINRAKHALGLSNEKYYLLKGFEDMELSTQALIKACLKLGVTYEVLDRKDNFVRLTREGRTEYVKQATKTSRDSCASILLMRNKQITKRLLDEVGINTPNGKLYESAEEAKADFPLFADGIVVKPNFKNFGTGVTVFSEPPTKEDFDKAVDIAFSYGDETVVEEYVQGEDYRFLVIGDEVQAVSKRIPASVIGDGRRTIRDLIIEKSREPLRGEAHKKPLAFIGMGAEEELHLKIHGMSFMTVPADGEIVFLRKNSNVSTGGDAIDCTDVVHESYKEMALKAAKTVNAVFCGVDMMVTDVASPLRPDNYCVTELNFNPSIKIHCYPSSGKGRPIGETVVRFLFDMDKES